MPKKLDLTGRRFGGLIAIAPERNSAGRLVWKCACDCGATVLWSAGLLNCALTHIEEAQHWLQQRTIERMRRGVEGTHTL